MRVLHLDKNKRKQSNSRRTIRRASQAGFSIRPRLEVLEQRLAPTVNIISDFAGMSGGNPPDTCGATSPYVYVETRNSSVSIFNKTTRATIASDGLYDFLHNVGGITLVGGFDDATMIYDEPIGRFIVGDMDDGGDGHSGLSVAVSKSSNPTALDTN